MFYVFHGEDSIAQDAALAELKAAMGDATGAGMNTAVFDGRAALTLGQLRAATDTLPFLAPRRLVIVTDLLARLLPTTEDAVAGDSDEGGDAAAPATKRGKSTRGDLVAQLAEYVPELPPTTDLVFLERRALPARHALLKAADGTVGIARQFDVPTPDNLPRWLAQRARAHGGQISAPAANLLAQSAGGDLRALDQELLKLITYAGGRPVAPADVQALVPAALQTNIFALVDALGQRDTRQAARLVYQHLAAGEHPLSLLAMIVRQFRLLVQVKELATKNVSPTDISQQLKLHGFVAKKLSQQAQRFTQDQLTDIYRRLLETDAAIKSGAVDAEAALDTFVASVGGGR